MTHELRATLKTKVAVTKEISLTTLAALCGAIVRGLAQGDVGSCVDGGLSTVATVQGLARHDSVDF
jgi:hypothetical protein